jgi:DNA-binding transcriptional ArsR family regulator
MGKQNFKSIPPEVLAHCAAALKVLAHPVRLRAVELLQVERLTVGELAEAIDKPQAEVSQHLSKMKSAGLVLVKREGRAAYYRIANPACVAVLDCIRRQMVK